MSLFLKGRCPRCNCFSIFEIVDVSKNNNAAIFDHFHMDDWRTFVFSIFSASTYCRSCEQRATLSFSRIESEISETTVLRDFASPNGELIAGSGMLVDFDVPPLLPSVGASFDQMIDTRDLFRQAERCFDIHAWDAVGMLCRKLIDIHTRDQWKIVFRGERSPELYARIGKLLWGRTFDPEKVKRIGDISLNFKNQRHQLLYQLDWIRRQGNEASHGDLIFDKEDAESVLFSTRLFLDSWHEVSKSLSSRRSRSPVVRGGTSGAPAKLRRR